MATLSVSDLKQKKQHMTMLLRNLIYLVLTGTGLIFQICWSVMAGVRRGVAGQ